MAIIRGGTSGIDLDIDSLSKAAKVTLYDALGVEILSQPAGAYMLPINIRHTAATAIGNTVWAMRNGSSKTVGIRRFMSKMGFDGTTAALTTLRYGIQRFSAATPIGGSSLVPIKKRSSYAASTVLDVRAADTGLTTTGITFEGDAIILGLPIQAIFGAPTTGYSAPPDADYDIMFEASGERSELFELAPNEGLAIRLNTAAMIGLSLNGFIEWEER